MNILKLALIVIFLTSFVSCATSARKVSSKGVAQQVHIIDRISEFNKRKLRQPI